ncbi:HAD-IA family hydrolase [Actinoplanes sp. NPDC051470]|uniref:HAD family hydrolase n=1 Tax=Actinoplanes sp. NPDC051470 TaxID=3157224 RepID=UPI003414903F
MLRKPAQALLIDLDGVLRHWDPAVPRAVEEKYGLEPGLLLRTAMTWELYRPAVAGEITDAQWMELVASRLPLPPAEAAVAVAEWQTHRGAVDQEVLDFVREVRAAGRPVGLATNATDRLRADLASLGLADEFDVILSSWELKIHKPAPEFFAQAAEALATEPPWVMVVDDDDRVIRAARAAKMVALRWTARRDFGYLRPALGL